MFLYRLRDPVNTKDSLECQINYSGICFSSMPTHSVQTADLRLWVVISISYTEEFSSVKNKFNKFPASSVMKLRKSSPLHSAGIIKMSMHLISCWNGDVGSLENRRSVGN